MTDLICGLSWEEIQNKQQGIDTGRKINTIKTGDHGADPIGDGTFKMVPSGDIVNLTERNARLTK